MPVTEHFKDHGTALLVDGVRSRKDILFRADVPNGKYRVTVSLGDLLQPMGSISLYANEQLIEKNIALHHGLYRGIRDQGDPARPSATGFYDRIRFTIQIDQGTLLIRLSGDETEYKRLMRIEQAEEQPAIFMGTRKLRNQKPPYEDVGEPFKDVPLLGVEMRPHVEPPVTMPRHGKLRYTGESEDVKKVVAAFNAGEYAKAEEALESAGQEDPLGAALACLWLIGWPVYENEQKLLPRAEELLEEALAGAPDNAVALERAQSFY
jgi:tetratricopeptide (TPR) repeat protein